MLAIRTAAQPNAALMGLSPVRRFTIADGTHGTAQTIEHIRELVHKGMTDQAVNRLAIEIVRSVPSFDFGGEVHAIYQWVLSNFRFVRDVFGVETLRTVRELLSTRAGDCDCINAVLLPSLLMTIGNQVRLVTISTDPTHPNTFSHIYCEAELPNGQWIPLDSARRNPAFGRGPQHFFRMRRWSLTDRSYQDVPAQGMAVAQPPSAVMGGPGLSGYFADLQGYLGDFTDVAGNIADLIAAGGTAASQIITSLQPRFVPQGFAANPVNGQIVPVGAFQGSFGNAGLTGSGFGTIPNWILYAGFGLAALLVLKK